MCSSRTMIAPGARPSSVVRPSSDVPACRFSTNEAASSIDHAAPIRPRRPRRTMARQGNPRPDRVDIGPQCTDQLPAADPEQIGDTDVQALPVKAEFWFGALESATAMPTATLKGAPPITCR